MTDPTTIVLVFWTLVGLAVASVVWDKCHDPRALAQARNHAEVSDRAYRAFVVVFCLLTIFAWPLTTAYLVSTIRRM